VRRVEIKPMSSEQKTAIDALTKKSSEAEKPDDAMKYAQAALNLAHVVATMEGAEHLARQK
jgi:hypothetical protein